MASGTPRSKDYIFEPFKVTEVKFRSFECPRPRSGHRIACDENRLYCFGGYNPSLPFTSIENENPTWSPDRPLFKELWSYSIATRKWTLHKIEENMPEELASNAMCVYGRYLMIYGGTGEPFGHKCSNDVIVWRTNSNEPKLDILEVTGTRPPGQYGQAILCHDGCFYTFGGTNGFAYNCDIYRLDLRTLKWESLYIATGQEDEPIGRYRHEVIQYNNKFYVIGGGTGEWAFELMELPIFDLETRKWDVWFAKPDEIDQQPVTPFARKCHSAVQLNTPDGVQVFVVGGSDGHSVFKDIWRFNVKDLQWTLMRESVLFNPLYFHSSTVTPAGCMYIFGGIEPKNNYLTSRNNSLYKMWVCIPKLSEICFEAIMHFNPNLDQVNKNVLLNIGIPKHFVQRIHT